MGALVVLGNSPAPPGVSTISSVPPPRFHLLAGDPPLVLAVDGSRFFETTREFFEALQSDTEGAQRELLDMMQVSVVRASRKYGPGTHSHLTQHRAVLQSFVFLLLCR